MKRPTAIAAAAVILALSVLGADAAAQAQRREGRQGTLPMVTLRRPVRFGDVTVARGDYRVFIVDQTLTLADPHSMVTVATIAVRVTTKPDAVATPKIEVIEKGDEVKLQVRVGNELLTAIGQRLKDAPRDPGVQYESKTETSVGTDLGAKTSEDDLINSALARYINGIAHCGENAHRSRWFTDDPRFIKCACPIIEKWRMPTVSADKRVDRTFPNGKVGFSFTITPEGKVQACRVWMGPKPPPAKDKEPTSGSLEPLGAAPSKETTPAPAPKTTAPAGSETKESVTPQP